MEQSPATPPPAAAIADAVRTELIAVNAQLIELDQVEAGLKDLETQLAGVVFDVKTRPGMVDAIASRALVRSPRLDVERIRKVAKAPVLALGRSIDARAAAITGRLVALEQPIDDQIKVEEQRKANEKALALEEERLRVAAIRANIASIAGRPAALVGWPSPKLADMLERLRNFPEVGRDFYEEFADEAQAALTESIERIAALLVATIAHEAELAALIAEREELAILREADAQRRIAEAEADESRRAEQALADQAAREVADKAAAVERGKAMEAAAAERDRLTLLAAAEQAERKAIADREAIDRAEADRLAAIERKAETERLASERAELERQRLRLADEAEAAHLAALTLVDAATDAYNLLCDNGMGLAAATRRLGKVLAREQADAAVQS